MLAGLLLLLLPPRAIGLARGGVRMRRVRFDALSVGILEVAEPGPMIQSWMAGAHIAADPFGVVLWPGAHAAVRLMQQHADRVAGRRVLCLGAGTGLEALAAAQLGAAHVLACDINPLSLSLLRDAAAAAGLSDVVSTRELDLISAEPLPTGYDVCVFADLLYNEELAGHVGRRAAEAAFPAGAAPWLVVSDSQRFAKTGPAFLAHLWEGAVAAGATGLPEWRHTTLEAVTGSGILVEEDVTSDVEVRYLSWRWRRESGAVREDELPCVLAAGAALPPEPTSFIE